MLTSATHVHNHLCRLPSGPYGRSRLLCASQSSRPLCRHRSLGGVSEGTELTGGVGMRPHQHQCSSNRPTSQFDIIRRTDMRPLAFFSFQDYLFCSTAVLVLLHLSSSSFGLFHILCALGSSLRCAQLL